MDVEPGEIGFFVCREGHEICEKDRLEGDESDQSEKEDEDAPELKERKRLKREQPDRRCPICMFKRVPKDTLINAYEKLTKITPEQLEHRLVTKLASEKELTAWLASDSTAFPIDSITPWTIPHPNT